MFNREMTLRIFLNNKLSNIHSRNYYETAPDDTVYPFLVYNLEESFDDGSIETFNLVMDAWDNKTDTTEIVQLISDVDNSLHRLRGSADGLFFIFYRNNRRTITDNDSRLRRRQLEFEIKVMGGNR